MTREQFETLPESAWDEEIECDSIIILPSTDEAELHDSGYRRMNYVLEVDHQPVSRKGGGDVFHLDGIGGYGRDWLKLYGTVPALIPPSAWSIDCLAKSGLLRLFTSGRIVCGLDLSSMEIYALPREDKAAQS